MLVRLAEQPDLTVRSSMTELGERSFAVSHNTVWSLLRAAGFNLKKGLFADERDQSAVARRRQQWKKYRGRREPRRLVFIDET